MTTQRKSLLMLFHIAVLYSIAACLSCFLSGLPFVGKLPLMFLMALSISLMLYFSEHIIDPMFRRYLLGISALVAVWILLRGAKYSVTTEAGALARHLWYMYYIPALLIPLLSLLAALSVGGRSAVRPNVKTGLVAGVTLLLVIAVLTNDLHQLVFRFQPNFLNWDADYSRGFVFILICFWSALLFVGTIYILLSRCRVSASRRLVWIPALPALFEIIYMTLYAVGAWPRLNGNLFGEFPEAVCFTVAGIWLSIIYIGLIPSNIGYGKLFELSDLSAQIADKDYRIIYQSRTAAPLSPDHRRALETVSLDKNTRLHRREIYGGFVYWQDDITVLNQVNEELWEVGERLKEEAELVRLENELKEERAQIEAKTKTYAEIAACVMPQSRKIAALCAQVEHSPELYAHNIKIVCVLALYIKRFSNLSLLAADNAEIEASELFLAVQEPFRVIRDMGIPADVLCLAEGLVTAKRALEAYTLLEQALEQTLSTLRGVQVSISDDAVKCVFEGAVPQGPLGRAELTTEDGNAYLRIPLREAGDAL